MGLWLDPHPLVLASKSAVRRTLLEAAGIPVEVRPADIDERAIEAVRAFGRARRGRDAARDAKKRGRYPCGRPEPRGARRRPDPCVRHAALQQAGGSAGGTRSTANVTGACRIRFIPVPLGLQERQEIARLVSNATLTMRNVSDDFVERYLDAAGPNVLTSVGGYQLEGIGIHLFEKIEGDHFTILGLPLLAFSKLCAAKGCWHDHPEGLRHRPPDRAFALADAARLLAPDARDRRRL